MRNKQGVQEEECTLEKGVHPSLEEEIKTVRVEEERGRQTGVKRPPPPAMVLGI